MIKKWILAVFVGTLAATLALGAGPAGAQAGDGSFQAELVRKINVSQQGVTWQNQAAVDRDLNLYVMDGVAENPHVYKYDKHGRFLLSWGGRGSGPGQFELWPANPEDGPNGGFLAIDNQNNVYVSDTYNFRVQKFDPQGHFLMQFGEPGFGPGQIDPPAAGPLSVDRQGNIWLSTFSRIQKFDTSGHFLASYGSFGSANDEFMGAGQIAFDRQGNMYVADFLNGRVQKLDPQGNFLMSWGAQGSGSGGLNLPVEVVIDQSSRLYVADNTDHIQVYDTQGGYIGQITTPTQGLPYLGPLAVSIDRRGMLYLSADLPTSAVYLFSPQ